MRRLLQSASRAVSHWTLAARDLFWILTADTGKLSKGLYDIDLGADPNRRDTPDESVRSRRDAV